MSPYIDFHAVVREILASQPSLNQYFLLDAGGLPGLHQQLLKTSVKWSSLFDCSREVNAVEVAPFLVMTGSCGQLRMSRSMIDWLSQHGTFSSSVVMLSSPLDMAPLRNRLAARLEVKLSENMEAMLRFFDPRVLESLIKILQAEQAQLFFSPAESWRYVDRAGKVVSLATAFDANEKFSAPLLLGEREEFELLEACEIDQVLYLLREILPRHTAALSPSELFASVDRAISVARKQGVRSVYTYSIYAAVLLIRGEAFAAGPQGLRFIEELKKDDFNLEHLEGFEFDTKGMDG